MRQLSEEHNESLRVAISSFRGRLSYSGDRVFMGNLDDSVSRYPFKNRDVDIKFLNRRLVDQVLFGAPVCIRVGNLLYQSEYLEAIKNSNASPLIALAKVGFVQIQMKGPTINESIQARLVTKTQSAIDMVKKEKWKPGSDLYLHLEKLDAELSGTGGKLQYEGKFNKYFRGIMTKSESEVTDEFLEVLKIWLERGTSDEELRRDRFEKIAIELFAPDTTKIRRAMWVANAANHWAYVIELAAKDGKISDRMPMVETTQFDRHADVCAHRQPIPTEMAEEIFERQNRKDPVNLALNMIQIPQRVYDDPDLASKLATIARAQPTDEKDRDYRLHQEFLNAKNDLISCINRYLSDPSSLSSREIAERAQTYQKVLYEALGTKEESDLRLSARFILRKTLASGPEEVAKATIGGGAGAVVGAGAAVVSGPVGLAAGILGGIVVGVGLSSVKFNGNVSLPWRKNGSDMETACDVESDDPEKDMGQLEEAAHTATAYGTYTGVRTVASAKASEIIKEFE
jgi:hypothetical protein